MSAFTPKTGERGRLAHIKGLFSGGTTTFIACAWND
jgi:hypothetical protein